MSNETIFREVDEELRSDRMRSLWKRFGPYVIGAAVAVVLVVAANEGWTWWQESNAAKSSDEFYAALEQAEAGDIAAAQAALNGVVANGTGGYPTLARFRQAALLAADGKPAEAAAAYDALATAQTNTRIRDLALVLAAYVLVDGGDVAAVQQRVGGVAVDGNPLRNVAREAIGLTQFKAGELKAANATFQVILTDPLVTQDTAERVRTYSAQLIALGALDEPRAAAAPAAEAPAVDVVDPALVAPVTPEAPATPETPADPASEPAAVTEAPAAVETPAAPATTTETPAAPAAETPAAPAVETTAPATPETPAATTGTTEPAATTPSN